MQSDIWQHIKSGGFYQVLHGNVLLETDRTAAVVYRSLSDGQIWVRPHAEFHDGRFRNLSAIEAAEISPGS